MYHQLGFQVRDSFIRTSISVPLRIGKPGDQENTESSYGLSALQNRGI